MKRASIYVFMLIRLALDIYIYTKKNIVIIIKYLYIIYINVISNPKGRATDSFAALFSLSEDARQLRMRLPQHFARGPEAALVSDRGSRVEPLLPAALELLTHRF